jgi:hypothetical protein
MSVGVLERATVVGLEEEVKRGAGEGKKREAPS